MKMILSIAFICLTYIGFSQEETLNAEKHFDARLTFGRHGNDCSGRGVCSFSTGISKEEANVNITYDNKDKKIILTVDKLKISNEDRLKITGNYSGESSRLDTPNFVIEEDFVFDLDPKLNLDINSIKIPKGDYPLEITESTLVITLKLE